MRFKNAERKERQEADEKLKLWQKEFEEDSKIKRLKLMEGVKEKEEKNKAEDKKNTSKRKKGSDEEMDSKKGVGRKKVTDATTIIVTDNNITMRRGEMDDETTNVTEKNLGDEKRKGERRKKPERGNMVMTIKHNEAVNN